jgi:hypothetical protein
MVPDDGSGLTPADRRRLAAFRAAERLADLVDLTGAESEHAAYFAAKREWRDLRGRELSSAPETAFPGTCVTVDGTPFCVDGVTHADTTAERAFLREHVSQLLADGAGVYCEQGIRRMYFPDRPDVCAMDDYRWAMARCAELDAESYVADLLGDGFDGIAENFDSLASRFQNAVFALVHSGREVYGEEFARALGDVASDFLTSHEGLAVGDEFESFRLSRVAAEDPRHLPELQRYYERAFLPQPLEREWLRRHDPELELVTHARNERMADYAVYHHDAADRVHLVVGAAHQPGVRYYLEQFRDGTRTRSGFEPVE